MRALTPRKDVWQTLGHERHLLQIVFPSEGKPHHGVSLFSRGSYG